MASSAPSNILDPYRGERTMIDKPSRHADQFAALSDIIAKFGSRRILCVGDVMLDRFRYGDVKRISPEAPVPIVSVTRERAALGGAGNVIRNLSALAAHSSFISVVGDDRAGGEVSHLLGDLEDVDSFLRVAPGRQTTIKTRYFNHAGYNLLRADRETSEALNDADLADLERAVVSQVEEADAVILSDYGKGVLSGQLAAFVVAAAHKAGKPVVVDPKGTKYKRYAGARAITPNRIELEQATDLPAASEDAIIAAANALRSETRAGAILVTRSAEGMTLVNEDGAHHMLATTHEVADVTGAGDTVVAVFALALACGASQSDAAYLSNVAAGLVVARHGTATVSAQDITAALLHTGLFQAEQKVVDSVTAKVRAKSWRVEKLKIGFTNGCFDLLHPGHVSLLRQARSACDRLIVGLNSDFSVSRLKGEGRPVQSETARAAVMASLETVDLVVIFGGDTPLELIEALRPDVLVKGADYARPEVVGGDLVEGYGGQVVLADVVGPYSTTATIAAMAAGRRAEK
jgi:D-beta-D-heptose 7-phosphate kinase/D-beta-D-heptose 1-phosphate adenosyltransferase